MSGADLLRAAAAWRSPRALALSGALEVWHVAVLAAMYGDRGGVLRSRRSTPSCRTSCRPSGSRRRTRWTSSAARWCSGWRARHGALVASGGAGVEQRQRLDLFAAVVLWLVRVNHAGGAEAVVAIWPRATALRARTAWPPATFASAAVAYLCFMGPVEVLLPYLVKNDLEGSARDLGMSSPPAESAR